MWDLVNIGVFNFAWENKCGKCCLTCKTKCDESCVKMEIYCNECEECIR